MQILQVFLFIMAAVTSRVAKSITTAAVDAEYPGTAVKRMLAARDRARALTPKNMSRSWPEVRKSILWAAGLKDLQNAAPGKGYTGHSFNDWNHVDATCMLGR